MNTKITPEIMLAIQERSAIGHSLRDISKWLKTAHNIDYSHLSVKRVVDKQRKERYVLSEEILRPILEKRLTSDMDMLDKALAECLLTIDLAKSKGDQKLKMQALDRLDKFLRISFKVKGVPVDDNDDIQAENDISKLVADFSFLESKKNKDSDKD